MTALASAPAQAAPVRLHRPGAAPAIIAALLSSRRVVERESPSGVHVNRRASSLYFKYSAAITAYINRPVEMHAATRSSTHLPILSRAVKHELSNHVRRSNIGFGENSNHKLCGMASSKCTHACALRKMSLLWPLSFAPKSASRRSREPREAKPVIGHSS